MAKKNIAINGFGRIGRNAFKIAFERSDIEIVAINDLTDTKTLAHLLKYDTNYGIYEHDVKHDETSITVKGHKIKVFAERDPAKLPWNGFGVDVVIECTGLFTDPEKAKVHITEAGAKKVILSAPAKNDDADTIVLGVNEDKIEGASDVISNASCTTNCITPVMAVLESNFGIEKAMMTTVHSYTADSACKMLRIKIHVACAQQQKALFQPAPARVLRRAKRCQQLMVCLVGCLFVCLRQW